MPSIRPDFGPDKKPPALRGANRGEFVWRGVRYFGAVAAGYLFGVSAGAAMPSGPSLYIAAAVGLVALWLVFRKGKQSNAHAAADALAAAIVDVQATATATQSVTVAGGHVLNAGQVPIPWDASKMSYDEWRSLEPPSDIELSPRDQNPELVYRHERRDADLDFDRSVEHAQSGGHRPDIWDDLR